MDEVLWRYAPDSAHQGAFIFGVPARDLTQADLDTFKIDVNDLAASPLYIQVVPAAPIPVWAEPVKAPKLAKPAQPDDQEA